MSIGSDREFSIGRVVSRTFGIVGGDLVTPGLITLLLSTVPGVVLGLLLIPSPSNPIGPEIGLITLPLTLLRGWLGLLAQASIIYWAIGRYKGQAISIGEALARGLAHWWKIFLVGICVGFMSGLASILLIVPGIMLYLRWSVAIPAQVAENTGVFAAMKRSADLTKGRRWSIFGLLLVAFMIILILEMAFIVLVVAPQDGLAKGLASPLFAVGFTPALGLIITPLFSTGLGVLYAELRASREGADVQALGEVFE